MKEAKEGERFMATPEKMKVILKILSVKGTCEMGHQKGQEFDLSQNFLVRGVWGDKNVPGVCPGLFNAIYPFMLVLLCGGELHWEKDSGIGHFHCQDPFNGVVAELRRVRE